MKYSKLVNDPRRTPQTEQADPRQVQNNAGGFTFKLEPLEQLKRFLILGSDQPTFYASAKELTVENTQVVTACLDQDVEGTLKLIAEVSSSGRAPSNDPAIVATAFAIAHRKTTTAQCKTLVASVCRIGTHIFNLCEMIKQLRGWGRKARAAVASWYESRDGNSIAFQAAKYGQRNGWSHRDVLRVSHPTLTEELQRSAADWICGRVPEGETPKIIGEYHELQNITHAPEIAYRIKHNPAITWEMIPSELLREKVVWQAFLERGMPLGALLRNLGRLGSLELLKPMSDGGARVVNALGDQAALLKARVHPVAVLKAMKTYAQGHGVRGSLSWTPNQDIVGALEDAFELSFGALEKSDKATLIGLDVSGSMGWTQCVGANMLSCAEGAAAMAMVTYRSETRSAAMAFSHSPVMIDITKRDSLRDVMSKVGRISMGGTDCALPMVWALQERIEVDTFVVYTDNETWAGRIHPHQALEQYRNKMGREAKLVVVGMASNGFTIAKPDDPGMLDCVGFDTATPNVIAEFAK